MNEPASDPAIRLPRPAPLPPRLLRLAVGAALALHCVLAWLARPPGILTGQDDTEYIALAESLRHGTYREVFRVDAPLHYQYPPGYPALLALWGGIFGDSFDALAALTVLTSAAALLVAFLALRRVLGDGLGLAVLGLLAINPELVKAAGSVMSEPLYMLASLVALTLLLPASAPASAGSASGGASAGAAGPGPGARPSARHVAAAAAATLFAAMTRTAGITLVGAVLLHWLLERRWKLVLVPAVLALLTAGAWLIWGALDPEQQTSSSYVAELRALLAGTEWTGPLLSRAGRAVRWYLSFALPWNLALPTVPGTAIDNVAGLTLMLGFGGIGAFVWWKRWRAATLYLLAYAFLLTVWLWYVDRFVLPLVPLTLGAILAGAAAVRSRFRRMRWLPLTVVLILAVGAGTRTMTVVREAMACPRTSDWPPAECLTPEVASYFEALRWIQTQLPEDAVFLTAKTGALWYHTGRKSVSYEVGSTREPQQFVPWLRRQGAGWVILGSLWIQDPRRLAPRIQANCNDLVLEASFGGTTWLFRIEPATPEQAAATCAAAAESIRANQTRVWGPP